MAAMTVESNDDAAYMQTTADSGNHYQPSQGSLQDDGNSSSHPPVDIPEEECWLFKAPQSGSFFPAAGSCLAWVREIFDSPSSQFYHRRWDLLHRLEVILATEPAKRLPNLGGSVPVLNTSSTSATSSNGSSGQNFGPGSSATFVRPKRYTSDVIIPSIQPQQPSQLPQPSHQGRQRSSPIPFNSSSDDLQNVADLQSIARKQADELKAEVAAISAHQQASRIGGSQQSLNRSGPDSPYTSQSRLNTISSSPTPSDIAKQQMAALRLSLDSQRQNLLHKSDENLVVGGEASITSPEPGEGVFGLGMPQAVIVGRPSIGKPGSRLPAPMPARKGPRFPSAEALPSFGWSTDGGPLRRSSQEQLTAPRRYPGAQPRMGLLPSPSPQPQ